jgi:hypothetical protein
MTGSACAADEARLNGAFVPWPSRSLGWVEEGTSERYPRDMFKRGGAPAPSPADAERQALFEQLAQRPETVCPFLGLADARADYEPQATDQHRCYAFGDPEPVSGEQQRNVFLQRGYANCPRYLRGVLVIPTDELEALRRPPQKVPPPPPTTPAPPASDSAGGRRRIAAVLVLLLLLGGGAGAWYFLAGPGAVAVAPTPTPVAPSVEPSVAASAGSSASGEPSGAASPTPLPTPEPGDEFIGYEVTVQPGTYDIFRIDDAGAVVEQNRVFFNANSQAPVDRVVGTNGLLHWRVLDGDVAGWSYVRGDSGDFGIREVYRGPDGSLRYAELPEAET